jgi:hypothetical protein
MSFKDDSEGHSPGECLVHQSVNIKVKALLAGYESPRRVCPLPPAIETLVSAGAPI